MVILILTNCIIILFAHDIQAGDDYQKKPQNKKDRTDYGYDGINHFTSPFLATLSILRNYKIYR